MSNRRNETKAQWIERVQPAVDLAKEIHLGLGNRESVVLLAGLIASDEIHLEEVHWVLSPKTSKIPPWAPRKYARQTRVPFITRITPVMQAAADVSLAKDNRNAIIRLLGMVDAEELSVDEVRWLLLKQ